MEKSSSIPPGSTPIHSPPIQRENDDKVKKTSDIASASMTPKSPTPPSPRTFSWPMMIVTIKMYMILRQRGVLPSPIKNNTPPSRKEEPQSSSSRNSVEDDNASDSSAKADEILRTLKGAPPVKNIPAKQDNYSSSEIDGEDESSSNTTDSEDDGSISGTSDEEDEELIHLRKRMAELRMQRLQNEKELADLRRQNNISSADDSDDDSISGSGNDDNQKLANLRKQVANLRAQQNNNISSDDDSDDEAILDKIRANRPFSKKRVADDDDSISGSGNDDNQKLANLRMQSADLAQLSDTSSDTDDEELRALRESIRNLRAQLAEDKSSVDSAAESESEGSDSAQKAHIENLEDLLIDYQLLKGFPDNVVVRQSLQEKKQEIAQCLKDAFEDCKDSNFKSQLFKILAEVPEILFENLNLFSLERDEALAFGIYLINSEDRGTYAQLLNISPHDMEDKLKDFSIYPAKTDEQEETAKIKGAQGPNERKIAILKRLDKRLENYEAADQVFQENVDKPNQLAQEIFLLRNEINALLILAREYCDDPMFRSYLFEILVDAPTIFFENIDLFPFTRSEALRYGALLEKDRERFAQHFGIDPKKLEINYAARKRNQRIDEERLQGDGGNCFGYVIALISQNRKIPIVTDETLLRAQNIQAATKLNKQAVHILPQQEREEICEILQFFNRAFDKNYELKDWKIFIINVTYKHFKKSKIRNHEQAQYFDQYLERAKKLSEKPHHAIKGFVAPVPLLKKYGLRNIESAPRSPLRELPKQLSQCTSGKFELGLHDKSQTGHSLYVSLDPPAFSDVNDKNPVTHRPRVRTFATVEEMENALKTHLAIKYDFTHFKLTRYENIE
jgi:hypothetical protein